MDFQNVIGHEQIIKHLQNAIQMRKLSHAYIFNGEDGSGKNLVADIFAATLQCKEKGIMPCNKCKSCLQAFTGNHPDIIRVTHDKFIISVDDIRTQLNNDIQIKPFSSPYKIYLIDEAEKLNEQAQNALLKTIEEPPEYGIIILMTNNSNLFLPTILSRCIKLEFKPLPKEKIMKFLMEQYNIPDYKARLSTAFSGGNLGKAIKYACSEEFSKNKEEVSHLMKHINEMKDHELIAALKYFSDNKKNMDECIDLIELWFRDILMFKATYNANLLLFKEEIWDIQKQAQKRSFEGIEKILKDVDKLKLRLKANVNFDVAVELLLFSIQEH